MSAVRSTARWVPEFRPGTKSSVAVGQFCKGVALDLSGLYFRSEVDVVEESLRVCLVCREVSYDRKTDDFHLLVLNILQGFLPFRHHHLSSLLEACLWHRCAKP